MNITNNFLKIFLCLTLVSESVFAYELSGSRWPGTKITMSVSVPGEDGLWNRTFEQAMFEWGVVTDFSFFIAQELSDPCDDKDKRSGVVFAETQCGDELGRGTLAVTITRFDQADTDGETKQETDMIFNSTKSWNVYDGALVPAERGGSLQDFHRVALHELGHVLGLGHTPQGSNSIMAPFIANIDSLRLDDIHGAKGVNNAVFMRKCIQNFRQYVGVKSGKGYQCGDFTCQDTTGGSRLKVLSLALPHNAEPNDTLWYFTNNNGWQRISFTELGFCN